MPDETRLFQQGNKNLCSLIISPSKHTRTQYSGYQSDNESDDEGPVWVYPAFRPIKSTAEGKRKVLDGVYPPPRPWKQDDSKEKPVHQYEILMKKDK
ncbi:hypothetical protein BDN67DRAFT_1017934 [Paxillus ammoniavirescens]|nr:hypothetical protein BDN67DRAFT_1017934 [Paxillus ammoniavirescens]